MSNLLTKNNDNDICEVCVARYLNNRKPKYAQSERFIPLSIHLEQWKSRFKHEDYANRILKEWGEIFKQQHIFNLDMKLTGCDIPMWVFVELNIKPNFIFDLPEDVKK